MKTPSTTAGSAVRVSLTSKVLSTACERLDTRVLGGLRFFVFELGDLVGDFLLACYEVLLLAAFSF